MTVTKPKRLRYNPHELVGIAPLITFRILFGGVMLASIIRFAWNGWIRSQYIDPSHFFPYYGFEWVTPFGATGMYLVFTLMGLAALGVMLGAFYRLSAVMFFLAFTYVELLDKTNYLNHYYFVSIIAFLMILMPAHRRFSIDCLRNAATASATVPRWTIDAIKLQLGLVYFFAGIAKIHPDWLLEAMPLKIWLPPHADLPVIGPLMKQVWVAYVFSWFGLLYDLTIPFVLLRKKWRPLGYAAVIGFHVMTYALFQIGMFPFIMVLATLIFFSEDFHERLLRMAGSVPFKHSKHVRIPKTPQWITTLLIVHFVIQIILPFRHLAYPGDLFWSEEGYRFSWRVMLMEKAGYAQFSIVDEFTGKEQLVDNCAYLTPNQEKMMSMQPDMLVQFAKIIRDDYEKKGYDHFRVKADVHVSLNGQRSQPYVMENVDLSKQDYGFGHYDWLAERKNK